MLHAVGPCVLADLGKNQWHSPLRGLFGVNEKVPTRPVQSQEAMNFDFVLDREARQLDLLEDGIMVPEGLNKGCNRGLLDSVRKSVVEINFLDPTIMAQSFRDYRNEKEHGIAPCVSCRIVVCQV
jgi:hypothetical protein